MYFQCPIFDYKIKNINDDALIFDVFADVSGTIAKVVEAAWPFATNPIYADFSTKKTCH